MKIRKKCGLLPNRGGEGGSRMVVKSQTSILEKYFFQWACRIILGPPQHVSHFFYTLKSWDRVRPPLQKSQLLQIFFAASKNKYGYYFAFKVLPLNRYVLRLKDSKHTYWAHADSIWRQKIKIKRVFIFWRRLAIFLAIWPDFEQQKLWFKR